MFSDAILEKIFADKEAQTVPIGCQSTMVHVIEKILDELGYDFSHVEIREDKN